MDEEQALAALLSGLPAPDTPLMQSVADATGMTDRYLAAILGVSPASIHNYRTGVRRFQLTPRKRDILRQMAQNQIADINSLINRLDETPTE